VQRQALTIANRTRVKASEQPRFFALLSRGAAIIVQRQALTIANRTG
jgi:hypothetical protein